MSAVQPAVHDSSADVAATAAAAAAAASAAVANAKATNPLNLQELVQLITEELSSTQNMNRIHQYMTAFDASLNEWKRYAFWDPSKKYTRNLIATDNATFTLMLLCWNPAKESPVHNHAGSECFMRVIDGRVVEHQYETVGDEADDAAAAPIHADICADQPMQVACAFASSSSPASSTSSTTSPSSAPTCPATCPTAAGLRLRRRVVGCPGAVVFINDSIGLHKIENCFAEPAVTLHLYLPPYESCKIYDESSGAAQTSWVTFHSEHGELTQSE